MLRRASRLSPGSFHRFFPRFAFQSASHRPSIGRNGRIPSVPRPRGIVSNPTSIGLRLEHGVEITTKRRPMEALQHYGRCYWELSKARLSMLVVATSGAGYVLGSGNLINVVGLCYTCAGTMMVAASANTLNQVFEVSNDAKMKRTMWRPLPSGRLGVSHAVAWASTVGMSGTALLAWKANALAGGLAASNLILYAFVYTPLKQIHPANTWVGAIVGSIPPLIGWAAACGEINLPGMILPAALYFWQIPHFMALAYLCRNDYLAGGFRMLSFSDISGERTALAALRNCLYLFPVGFFAYDWGVTSSWFCLESTLLTLGISAASLTFFLNRTTKNARRMFHASLLYLPVFMAGFLFHRLPNSHMEFLSTDPTELGEVPQADNYAVDDQDDGKKHMPASLLRPPVAYASIAPFPFLPAPIYDASSDSCMTPISSRPETVEFW